MRGFEYVDDERVVWGDHVIDVPTRGSDFVYQVDEESAWQEVIALYDSRHLSGIGAGKSKTSAQGARLADALLAAIDAREITSVDAGAALILACTYWGYDNSEAIVRWMIARHGLASATRWALAATPLGRDGSGDAYYLFEAAHAPTLLRVWEVERLGHDTANSLIAGFLEIRRAAAAATDEDYAAAALAVSEAWTGLGEPGRALAAIAFPGEGWWREVSAPTEMWNEGYYTRYACWLISAPDEPAAASLFARKVPRDYVSEEHAFAALARLGLDVVPVLDTLGSTYGATWTPVLEHLESVAAFALYPALGAYALPYLHVLERRPLLAARALAPIAANSRSGNQGAARLLLAQVVDATGPSILDVVTDLDERAAAALRQIAEPPANPAPADELPSFLGDPPWSRKRTTKKPTVLELEALTVDAVCHMTSAERKDAKNNNYGNDQTPNAEVVAEIRKRLARGGWYSRNIWAVAVIDEWTVAKEVIGELADDEWQFDGWYGEAGASTIVARWGVDAAEFFVRFGERDRVNTCRAAWFLEDARLAPLIAESFTRLKTARADAAKWLERYPRAAAIGLVPAALGKAKKPREYASNALRYVATHGHGDVVTEVAALYGDVAASAIAELLAADPFEQLPSKMPKTPEWFAPRAYPRLVVASSGRVFDDRAMEAAVTAISLSTLDDTYPGVPALRELCTPESLEAFALALFQTWQSFGSDSKQYWALYALGWFGADEAARTLAPLIRRWPGESAAKRATVGLDVLALIGTDVALMHIYGISQKVKYASIKKRAGQLVDELAAELGLSRDELGDRLVPDLDLAANGTTTIDYGARSFLIRLNEELKPIVFADGKLLKSLPKPGKTDAESAAEEQKRFKGLAADLRTVAKQQIERLEHAMCDRRRWSAADFQQFFVDHPLVINLTRRLVWGVFDGSTLAGTFRVDDEGAFVDANDDAFELQDRKVGIPHPIELGAAAAAWNAVFGDYELLQPFPQLSRQVRARDASEIEAIVGATMPAPKLVFGLEKHGWRRGEASDGGAFWSHEKEFGDVRAYIEYSGMVAMGYIEASEPLEIEVLRFMRGRSELALSDVDPVIFSETVNSVAAVIA